MTDGLPKRCRSL